MNQEKPQFIENRRFTEYEEEDIQKLNSIERQKFEDNPQITMIMHQVEQELGIPGHWEEHWLTTDTSGRRVYARIYYTKERAWALTADGQIIRKMCYPS
jgi:ABC-type dipeptide/oligopeptide/nickel transport system permease subunit